MPSPGVSLAAAASIGAGVLLVYTGLKGKDLLSEVQGLVQGKSPARATSANQIQPGSAVYGGSVTSAEPAAIQQELQTGKVPSGGSTSANEALGRMLASAYGWGSGQNWQALNYGWGTLESGWSTTAQNPGSGALGIAQALGHGNSSTGGSLGNEYGPVQGMTFSNSLYVSANSGSATAQIRWGLEYIKLSYGAPENVPGWLGQGGYSGY